MKEGTLMEEKRICPINPHGNGFCKGERCALWNRITTSLGGVAIEDETIEDCAINIIAFNLYLMGDKNDGRQ